MRTGNFPCKIINYATNEFYFFGTIPVLYFRFLTYWWKTKKKKDYIIILINIYCYLLLNYLLQLYPPLYTFHRDTLNIYPITQHAYCNFDNQLIKIQKKFIHKDLTYIFFSTNKYNLHKISCGKTRIGRVESGNGKRVGLRPSPPSTTRGRQHRKTHGSGRYSVIHVHVAILTSNSRPAREIVSWWASCVGRIG